MRVLKAWSINANDLKMSVSLKRRVYLHVYGSKIWFQNIIPLIYKMYTEGNCVKWMFGIQRENEKSKLTVILIVSGHVRSLSTSTRFLDTVCYYICHTLENNQVQVYETICDIEAIWDICIILKTWKTAMDKSNF